MTQTHPRTRRILRRLLNVVAGLAVVALAAAAFVLSYPDLRDLAERGGASRSLRPLYPGMVDGLVVVIVLALIVGRHARWWSLLVRRVLLLLVAAGVSTAAVQHAVWGYRSLPARWVNAGVAVAPWAILLIAVWLWLVMIFPQRTAARKHDEPRQEPTEEASWEDEPDEERGESIIPGLRATPPPPVNVLVASKDRSTPFGPPPPASTLRSSPTPPQE